MTEGFVFLYVLLIILGIVWSIFCIVLFLKVWGMTNDVREINHNLYEIAKHLEETHNEEANQK